MVIAILILFFEALLGSYRVNLRQNRRLWTFDNDQGNAKTMEHLCSPKAKEVHTMPNQAIQSMQQQEIGTTQV
ncbi:MAG TPA: hypothetical protein VGC17_06520 [Lactovum miscens]|uniref:hypothetical protein n=1 Tax=Lactovum miscens TaxID=190387 RepID=UPI002ED86B7A